MEKLRFFHTTDPVIERKRSIRGVGFQSNTDLRVDSIAPLGSGLRMAMIATSSGDMVADGVVWGAQAPS